MEADTTRSDSEWQVSNVTGRNGAHSPVRKILSVNEHGLVFRSSKKFEVCSELALGLHIARVRRPGTRFLNVAGFVVSCECVTECESVRSKEYGEEAYDITIVFERLGEEDRDLLKRICAAKEAASPKPRKFGELGLN